MKTLYSFFFCLFLTGPLTAQNPGLIYTISATECEQILRQEELLSDLETRQPLAKYRGERQLDSLPYGHYLILEVKTEELAWRTFSHNQHRLVLQPDNRRLAVGVLHKSGTLVDSARVTLRHRNLRYEPSSQQFQKRTSRGGLLVTYLPNDTLFYQLNTQLKGPVVWRHFKYFSGSKVGYFITTPYRWGSKVYYYFHRGIKYRQWRPRSWPFERLINRIRYSDDPSFRGYIATQQPVYRLGDTLQISAYLAKRKGSAYQKTVFLHLRANGKQILNTQLDPTTPGHYELDWILGDSLPIDQQYQLTIRATNWRNPRKLRHSFRVEDYELEEYNFSLANPSNHFELNQPATFTAQAEDTNGLPVAATTVNGQIVSLSFVDLYQDSTYVRDTIWQFQEEFGNRTQLELVPPDSIWPNAKLKAQLQLNFQGPSGEIESVAHSFQVNRPTWSPIIQLIRDSIYLGWSGQLPDSIQTGYLTVNGRRAKRQVYATQATIAANPLATHYSWKIGSQSVRLSLDQEGPAITFSYRWQGDSLRLSWQNPRRLPLAWTLDNRHSHLASGSDSTHAITVLLPMAQTKRQLSLRHHYIWAGRMQSPTKVLKAINQQLHIALEVPERVYPGETRTITAKVTDSRHRPAAGVALTNGAFNAQFRQTDTYSTSQVGFRGRRHPFVRQRFTASSARMNGQEKLNSVNYQQFGLDSLLYYQLRFPAREGFFAYRPVVSKDSLALRTAQFAPWLVDNHRAKSIELIHLDNRLVYYRKAWQDTPFSITAPEGYHSISLRTRDQEITIDSVLLKNGQRLDVSFDLANYSLDRLRVKAKSPHLDWTERQLLAANLFYLKIDQQHKVTRYLFDDPRRIYRLHHQSNRINAAWGLSREHRSITQLRPGIDTLTFEFEPHFVYSLSEGRERLYAHRPLLDNPKQKFSLGHYGIVPKLNQFALFPADISSPPKERFWQLTKNEVDTPLISGRLQIRLTESPKEADKTVLFLLSQEGKLPALYGATSQLIRLVPGDYQLSGLTQRDSVWQVDFTIRSQQLFAINIIPKSLDKKVLPPLWASYLQSKQKSEKPAERPRTRPNWNNYYRSGSRLISGTITDSEGEPLIGVNVMVRGVSIGTVTDIDGTYELWLPTGATGIEVSYTGFATQEIELSSAGIVDISLEAGQMLLDEVVIVGYGSARRSFSSDDINIRGSRDENSSYYIDGVRVAGKLIPESEINLSGSGTFLAKTSGLDIVEESQSDDVDLISNTSSLPAPINDMRQNFSDYAYWHPHLITNKAGEVSFPVTFPDDITNWQHYAVGMDRHARLGTGQAFTQSFLPLQAQLYTPRFLLSGDRAQVIGLLTNRSGEERSLSTSLQINDSAPLRKNSTFSLTQKEYFPLPAASATQDSIWLRYQLQFDDYQDGEKRAIPIYRKGVEKVTGGYLVLRDEQIQTINPLPNKGPVQLRFSNNNLARLLAEVDYLRDYPHHCNEQTASRLLALLATEALAPYQGKPVDLTRKIHRAIRRLAISGQVDGGWGWWKTSRQSSPWITQHVVCALQQAEAAGYQTPSTQAAERLLLSQLDQLNGERQLERILFFAEQDQVLDYASYLAPFDSLTRSLDMELAYRRIQQLQGIPYQLDSLEAYRQSTLTGASYWPAEPTRFFYDYNNNTHLNLLAHRIYQSAGDTASTAAIQQYFLEPKPESGSLPKHLRLGANTYESALLLHTLLADIQPTASKTAPIQVALRKFDQPEQLITTFPTQQTHSPEQSLYVQKSGTGPAFISFSQRYWEENPPPTDNGFQLSSKLMQEGQSTRHLSANQAAELVTTVSLHAEASYVMIEIPVPAGCSYGPKRFRETPVETHREYHREKVVLFCEYLPAGEYEFRINLEPRYPGQYTINPARAEMMYVPNFNGLGKTIEVVIK